MVREAGDDDEVSEAAICHESKFPRMKIMKMKAQRLDDARKCG